MKLEEIIDIADKEYGDGLVELYFTEPGENHGDGLAEFVSAELRRTYVADASDEAQLTEAERVMQAAAEALEGVASVFSEAQNKNKKG